MQVDLFAAGNVVVAPDVDVAVVEGVDHLFEDSEKAVVAHFVVDSGPQRVAHGVPVNVLHVEERVALVDLLPQIVERGRWRGLGVAGHKYLLAAGKEHQRQQRRCYSFMILPEHERLLLSKTMKSMCSRCEAWSKRHCPLLPDER